MDINIKELEIFIMELKNNSITNYQECVRCHGEDNLVCNIYTAELMAYGIVLNKIKDIYGC